VTSTPPAQHPSVVLTRARTAVAARRPAVDRRGALVLLALAALVGWRGLVANRDWQHDWTGGAGTSLHAAVAVAAVVLPLTVLCVLAALHYLASALALRAASGTRLPWGESYLNQLAAATANRLTPGGLGGAALNARYLVRRGVPAARAAGALAALSLVGAVADLLMLLGVASLTALSGPWRAPGAGSLPAAVSGDLSRWGGVVARHAVPIIAAGALAVVLGALVLRSSRPRPRTRRAFHALRAGFVELVALRRRPRDLLVMATASAGTTLVLGGALLATLVLVAGPAVLDRALPVLAAYLIGAALASAVPVPGGVGTTDAALVGALLTAGIRPGQAVPAVLLFRVVTHWAPAGLGLLAVRRLRRTRAYW
jgi:uncharacterized membrane protein YbhN (UPF0104 family)